MRNPIAEILAGRVFGQIGQHGSFFYMKPKKEHDNDLRAKQKEIQKRRAKTKAAKRR